MNNPLNKLSLVAVAVSCAMPTGYRRAGFSLEQGKNSLDVNQEQFESLSADKNLTVTVVSDNASALADGTIITAELEDQVTYLLKLNADQQEIIDSLRNELADVIADNHVDTLADLGDVVIDTDELDVSSAPQALHHWIAVIDDLNKEAQLTKKPNCDHLTITVEGEEVTPSAAERDAAWAWYQEKVINHVAD